MTQQQKNRKAALYTFIEVLVIILMTIVGNMWDWVNMSFTPERIMTMAFWQETMVKSILYSGCLVLGILLKLSKLELKDEKYANLYGEYRGHLPFKNQHKEEFGVYVDKVLNPTIKKEYLRTKLNSKLAKVQKHEKDKWVLDYFQAKESGNPDTYLFSSKRSKKYFEKRINIETMLADDFIEKHCQEMNVKYPRVSASLFTYYLEIKRNRDDEYKITNQVAKDTVKQATLKIVSVIFMSFAFTVFALNPQANELLEQANGWIIIMIQYIIRVMMMLISFISGVWTAKRSFMENYLLPLTNRISMLEDFEIYVDKHPVKEKGVEAVKEEAKEEMRAEYEQKLETAKKEIQDQAMKMVQDELNRIKSQNRGAIN